MKRNTLTKSEQTAVEFASEIKDMDKKDKAHYEMLAENKGTATALLHAIIFNACEPGAMNKVISEISLSKDCPRYISFPFLATNLLRK